MAKAGPLDINIVLLGLNHRSAGLDVREKLAFRPHELVGALHCLGASLDEAALLSTCHRTELYVAMHGRLPSRLSLEERLGRLRGLSRDQFAPHTYFVSGQAAVKHLFRVSCGLDSVVLGEYQVLGQVREALEAAEEAGTAGPTLRTLFAFALRLGRRARASTAIGRTAASISGAAVDLARRVVDLESAHIVLVGAGKMGELAARNLLKRGVGRFSVVARTLGRAERLTLQCGDAVSIGRLEAVLREADVVITATNAPHPVVTAGMVARVMQERQRALWFIDIAVPRDVEPDVADLPGVTLYNVDDLQEVAVAGLSERRAEVPKVLEMVEREVARFEVWCRERRGAPAVVALREHFDRLRREELARRRNRLDGLTAEQWQAVDALTVSILNKVLHRPTVALRGMAANGQSGAVPHVLAELFGVGLNAPRDTATANGESPLTIDTYAPPPSRLPLAGETPIDTHEMCGQVNACPTETREDGDGTRTPGRKGA